MNLLKNQTLLNKLILACTLIFGLLLVILFYIVLDHKNTTELLKQHAEIIMDLKWEEFNEKFRKEYNERNKNRHQLPIDPFENSGFRAKVDWDFHEKEFAQMINTSVFVSQKNDSELPDNVDWRKLGAVTKVRHQGSCRSSWAFIAAEATEAQYFRKSGQLIPLSSQNLLDCSEGYDENRCLGNYPFHAFNYITLHGIATESEYPYMDHINKCLNTESMLHVKSTGFVRIERGNEQHLKEAVATVGPVAVVIDGYAPFFIKYTGGVFDGFSCKEDVAAHGVLVVGYGTDPENGDYWLIKNTWGTQWGEDGYMRLARNKNNTCSVASAASYPVL